MPLTRREAKLVAIINLEQPVRLITVAITGGNLLGKTLTSSGRLNSALAALAIRLEARKGCHPETLSDGNPGRGLRLYLNQVGGRAAQLESLRFIQTQLLEMGVEEVRFDGLDEFSNGLIDELRGTAGQGE